METERLSFTRVLKNEISDSNPALLKSFQDLTVFSLSEDIISWNMVRSALDKNDRASITGLCFSHCT